MAEGSQGPSRRGSGWTVGGCACRGFSPVWETRTPAMSHYRVDWSAAKIACPLPCRIS